MKAALTLLLLGLATCANLRENLKAQKASSTTHLAVAGPFGHLGGITVSNDIRYYKGIVSFSIINKASPYGIGAVFQGPYFPSTAGADIANYYLNGRVGVEGKINGEPLKVVFINTADGCMDSEFLLSFGQEKLWLCPTHQHYVVSRYRTQIVINGGWINNQYNANVATGDIIKQLKDQGL